MKLSIILIVLLLLNTSALLADTISKLLSGVQTWVLILFEGILVVSYFVNKMLKDLHKVSEIDMSKLNLFVTKNKKSA